ncbi:hypothetical protein HRG_005942 [Hirsutella rhossiliensis]|uniref:Uncharacterized protein n=1 Tax=Hirsutella rhossiliensis TaxID=111463 RepID=A0A9P8N2B9_9HYPO|nr:uncharacterized protein HRG_05942 [Hirsutella rhossiliensis]KAH0963432.1 hypothetical protein HRG_05942 [Hirsutella rhossiliensis]
MAAQDGTLDARLFDDDDDAEDLVFKQPLDALVTQASTPARAAAQIDEWVVSEANRRYRELEERNPPFELADDESLYLVGPNASRHMHMLFDSVARLCSAFEPGSTAQDALVDFIVQLKALPKHNVPHSRFDEDENPVGNDRLLLWPLGTPSAKVFMLAFHREAEDLAYPFSDVEEPNSESQQRWRNLQSFIARITTLDLIDCSEVCALFYILPSSHMYPDLEKRGSGGINRIAGDLKAAAQWLLGHSVRQWVYERCRKNAEDAADGSREVWSMRNWKTWKEQMAFIAEDERFSEETRLLARSLLEKMDTQG